MSTHIQYPRIFTEYTSKLIIQAQSGKRQVSAVMVMNERKIYTIFLPMTRERKGRRRIR